MKTLASMTAAALIAAALTIAVPAPLSAASTAPSGNTAESTCGSVRPDTEFYEAGRKASFPLTVPSTSCTTISVSHIKDSANSSDRCQTFLVGFFPPDGAEATYTEPVTACSDSSSTRTVLASDVPDGIVYRVLYNIDYLTQDVEYKIWH